jgi:hypothetical protein
MCLKFYIYLWETVITHLPLTSFMNTLTGRLQNPYRISIQYQGKVIYYKGNKIKIESEAEAITPFQVLNKYIVTVVYTSKNGTDRSANLIDMMVRTHILDGSICQMRFPFCPNYVDDCEDEYHGWQKDPTIMWFPNYFTFSFDSAKGN